MKNQIRPDQRIDIVVGAPGTGKSFYMQQLIVKKKEEAAKAGKVYRLGYEYLILAPTGQAAKNVHGRTIHSLIGHGRTDYNKFKINGVIQDEHQKYFKDRIKVNSLQDIYIDEIGAVSLNLIESLDRLLCNAMNNYRQPFGGVNMILTGDSMQIKPVKGKTAFLYENLMLNSFIKVLKENKRFSGELLNVITDAQKNKYVNFKDIPLTNPEDLFICKHVIVDTNKKRYEYNTKSINHENKNYINVYFDNKEYEKNLENENYRPEILAPDREIILKSNRSINSTNFEYNGDRATLTKIGVYDYDENIESSEYEKRLFRSEKHFDIANNSEDVVVVFKYVHKCYVPEEDKEYEYNKYAIYRAYIEDGAYVCTENLRKTPNAIGIFYEEKLGTPFIDSFAITAHIAQGATIRDKYGIDLSSNSAAESSAYVALTRADNIDNIVFAIMSPKSRRIDNNMWAINHVLIQNDDKKFTREEFIKMANMPQEYAVPFDKNNASDFAIELQEKTNWPTINYENERKLMAENTRKMQLDDLFYKEQYCPVARDIDDKKEWIDKNGKVHRKRPNKSYKDIKRKKYKLWENVEELASNNRMTSTMMLSKEPAAKLNEKGIKVKPLFSSNCDNYVILMGFTIDVDDVFYDTTQGDVDRIIKKFTAFEIHPNLLTVSGNHGMHFKYLLKSPFFLDNTIRGGQNTAKAKKDNNDGFLLADMIKRVIEYICWYNIIDDELGSFCGKEQDHQGLNQGTTITGSLTKLGQKAVTFILNTVPVLDIETIVNLLAKYLNDAQLYKKCKGDRDAIAEEKKKNPPEEFNKAEYLEKLYKEQDILRIFEETPRARLIPHDNKYIEEFKNNRYDKYDFCVFNKYRQVKKDTATKVPNGNQEKQIIVPINFFIDMLKTLGYSEEQRIIYKKIFKVHGEVASGLKVPKSAYVQQMKRLLDFGLPADVLTEAFDAYNSNKGKTSAKQNAGLSTYKSIFGAEMMKRYKEAKQKEQNNTKQFLFRASEKIDISETFRKVFEDLQDYRPSHNSPNHKRIYRELCSHGIDSLEKLLVIVETNENTIKYLAQKFAKRGIVSNSMGGRYNRFLATITKAILFAESKKTGQNLFNFDKKEKDSKAKKPEKLFREIQKVIGDCTHTNKISDKHKEENAQKIIDEFIPKQSPNTVGRLSFYISNSLMFKYLESHFPCVDWETVKMNPAFIDKVALNREEKIGINKGTIKTADLFTSDDNFITGYEKLLMTGSSYLTLNNNELNAIKAPIIENKAEINKLCKADPELYSIVKPLIDAMDNTLGSISDAQNNLPKLESAKVIINKCNAAKTRRDNHILEVSNSIEGAQNITDILKFDMQITDTYKKYLVNGVNFDKEALKSKELLNSFKDYKEYRVYKTEQIDKDSQNLRDEMYNLFIQAVEPYNQLKSKLDIVHYNVDTSPENNKTCIDIINNWSNARKVIHSHTSNRINIKNRETGYTEWNRYKKESLKKKVKQFFDDRELEKERVALELAQKQEEEQRKQEEERIEKENYRNSILPGLKLAGE